MTAKKTAGRPTHDTLIRGLRAELEAEKKERETQAAQMTEMMALVRDLASEKIGLLKGEGISAAGLSQADVVQLIKAHGTDDNRRPDYAPLEGGEREELDRVDPLRFIDEKTQAVYFVGRTSSIPLRQPWVTQQGIRVKKKRLSKEQTMMWRNCPYYFGGRTPRDTESNMLNNRDWHFFVFTARDAREMWVGRDPFPYEAIVEPDKLSDIRNSEAFGEMRKSSGIPLREGARRLLQANRQMLWFNTDIYAPNWDGRYEHPPWNIRKAKRVFHSDIDPREPNPYSTGCPSSTGRHGGVLVPVGPTGQMLNQGWSGQEGTDALLAKHLAKGR